ncbi:MAG: alginate lyase family protein [Armatimonadota bacterium]|nr:alginate lyase family protein [Armatimonadota bacterium]
MTPRLMRVVLLFAVFMMLSPAARAYESRDLSEWYRDYATVPEGASISSPSKIHDGFELEGIIGGKNPVRGQDRGGCVFADMEQHEEFTIDLGQTRLIGLLEYDAELVRRTPSRIRVEISNESSQGPWQVVLETDSPNARHTIGLEDIPARWIHVDLGDNSDAYGSRIHRFRVHPRYHLRPAADVAKVMSAHLRRDLPEMASFWKAADAQRWDEAADELIKHHAAQAEPVKAKPEYKENERVAMWMQNRVEDAGFAYQFASSDWDWMALKPGAPGPSLGLLPGAYSIFHMITSAYTDSADEKYAQKVSELLTDYLRDFPYPGWDTNYEGDLIDAWVGLRAAGRCSSFTRMTPIWCAENKYFSRDLKMNLILSVWQHMDLLDGIRLHMGGNWLTNVNSSLFGNAIKYPEFAEQKTWLQDSMESFERSLDKDVFESGREVEDSTMYVPIAAGQMTHQYANIRKAGIKLKPEHEQKMAKLYDAIAWSSYANGSGPTIGDCGRLAELPPGGPFVPDYYMELYDRPDFKYMNSYGKEGKAPSETSRAFDGWYVMRTAWDEKPFEDARQMFFKNTQKGNRAHCHSDQLGFTVYAYNREILTDPGMTSYGLPSNEKMHSTAYHNTICANDTSQEDNVGDEHAWAAGKGSDFVDGSIHTCPTAIHRRQIVFLKSGAGLPDYWFVRDRVHGRAVEHKIDSNFHFSVGAEPTVSAKSVKSNYPSGGNLLICGAGSSPKPTIVDYSIADNKKGEVPAKFAQYQVKTIIPVKLDTFLVPYKGTKTPMFSVDELADDQPDNSKAVSAFTVRTAQGADVVYVSIEPGKERSFAKGKLISDAQAVALRFNKKGNLVYAFQYGGSKTTYKGRKVIEVASGQAFNEWVKSE